MKISLIILSIVLLSSIAFGIITYNQKQTLLHQYHQEVSKNRQLVSEVSNLEYDIQALTKNLENITQQGNQIINQLRSENQSLNQQVEELTFRFGKNMLFRPSYGDCDDSALLMYLYFKSLGYNTKVVTGNLELSNESYLQCNHCWVIVHARDIENPFQSRDYAYDWGHYYSDRQHYEYIEESYKELLAAALVD